MVGKERSPRAALLILNKIGKAIGVRILKEIKESLKEAPRR